MQSIQSILKRLDEIGFEKERRALAALSLSFLTVIYLMISMNAPPGWGPAFLALAATYLVAFLALAAEWFWGRWFASGLGWSGLMVAVVSLFMIGWATPLAIYGALHGIVVVGLLGSKMASRYDMQESWRQRYNMDEFGVARLRKTVTRASASLPSLILWALAPKEGGEGMLFAAAGIASLLAAVAGLRGLVRMRTWGLMAMASASVALWVLGSSCVANQAAFFWPTRWFERLGAVTNIPNALGVAAPVAAAALGLAVLPFLGPALRFLRRPAR
jgi:hypothetical protein